MFAVSTRVVEVGQVLANACQAVTDGAESVLDYLKRTTGLGEAKTGPDFGVSGIRKYMQVVSLCGQSVGTVDNLDGTSIQLTRRDSPDGHHHFIPVGWVERVDDHVYLTRNRKDILLGWQAEMSGASRVRKEHFENGTSQ